MSESLEQKEAEQYTLWPDVVNEDEGPYPRISQSGRIYTIPPVLVLANQPTPIYLTVRPRQITYQNNAGFTIYRRYDDQASVGSYQIVANAVLFDTVSSDVVWLFAPTQFWVNGAVAGLVIEVYE
jgi:hypothetical protein